MLEEGPLAASPLLSALSPRLQDELLAAAEERRLPAQEWLFREGEPGDRLYLVRAGRLRVVAEGDGRARVLRLLGSGAVLGELAVLTGAPRSASVHAVRDAELFEIDGERFRGLLQHSPELGAGLATALAAQIQRGGTVEPAEAPTAVVAIVAVEDVADDRAWEEVSHAFATLGDTVAQAEAETEAGDEWGWGRQLAELEREHDYVLLRGGLDGSEWSRFCLRQADRVVVLTPATPPPAGLAPPDGCDVLFLEAPTTEDVAAWFARADVRTHHVVPVDTELSAAAGRVARRLTGQSLGLVLSGGGARAFSHIGVLEVLEGEGLEIDRLGGC